MIRPRTFVQVFVVLLCCGIVAVSYGCAKILPYDLMRSVSIETIVYQTGLCDRLSLEQFHQFVSSFETNPKTFELKNAEETEVREIKVRRVLEIGRKIAPINKMTGQEPPGETFTFLPGVEECRMARFHLLVEVQDSFEPCVLEVVQVDEEIAEGLSECGPSSVQEKTGNIVTCARLRVCDLRLDYYRDGNLMAEFPRISEEVEGAEAPSEESESETQSQPPPENESKVVVSTELAELLEESAHILLNTFSYAAEMPPTNLFRALYPLPALEMIPSPVATLHELVRWLESNAYS